ncbi:MAG: protein kinase [Acidobacteriota bacterium]
MAAPTDSTSSTDGGSGSIVSRLFQPGLSRQLFFLVLGLVALAVGAAVLVTQLIGSEVASTAVRDDVRHSVEVRSSLIGARIDQLFESTANIAQEPAITSYLLEAIASNNPLSLTDQLEERQRELAFDFALVLDADGRLLVDTQRGVVQQEETFQSPLLVDALESETYTARGLWDFRDGLHYAALVPLSTGSVLQGYLLTAFTIDDAEAARLQEAVGAEVVFLRAADTGGLEPVASSMGTDVARTIGARLDPQAVLDAEDLAIEDEDAPPPIVQATVDGRDLLVSPRTLRDANWQPIGIVANVGSVAEAMAPFRTISSALGGVGLLAILLAAIASLILPHRLLAPIRRLTAATEAAAAGDYRTSIEATDRPDEVGRLARSFSTLLSDLREKNDMQLYLTELTRTMPEQEVGSPTLHAHPPSLARKALLGIQLRVDRRASFSAEQALGRLEQDLRRLARAVVQQNGRADHAVGHRLLALFDEPRGTSRALSAMAEIVADTEGVDMVAALVAGDVASGTISWSGPPMPAVTGPPVDLVEALLRIGRVGTVLVSAEARAALGDSLGDLQQSLRAHTSSVVDDTFYSLDFEVVARFAQPDLTATVDLTRHASTPATFSTGATGHLTLASLGPGQVLGGRFELLSELGAGGMGIVFKARDRRLDELVALKMLKHESFDNEEPLDQLKDELRLARKITHPNVLRTFDFGEADGMPFISMEFVRGVTLKRMLKASDRLPLSAGLHMARQLCRGLAAAHEQKVLHRDIKPENMILDPTGNVKLMDFGIAKPIERSAAGRATQGASIVGTPYYLAPEQLEGLEPDERADIYACGVVLYEIFTGRLPLPADGTLMQIVQRKMNEDPVPPSDQWPEIPPPLEALIMRCLARQPADRYASVDALLQDLEALRA